MLKSLFKYFSQFRNLFYNYKLVFLKYMINKSFFLENKKIKCFLKNGEVQNWSKIQIYNYLDITKCLDRNLYLTIPEISRSINHIQTDYYVNFYYRGRKVILHHPSMNFDWIHVFKSYYSMLDVKDKIVIDIGGYIGDSAIYFALMGAKKVISIEPFTMGYKYELENVELNGLGKLIEPLNLIYKGEDGYQYFNDPESKDFLGRDVVNGSGPKKRTISLQKLVFDYNITGGILKMTCEGCEQNILHERKDIFMHFDEIILRYYYGYEKLKKLLEDENFAVTYTEPEKRKIQNNSKPRQLYGILYAKKK